MSSDAMPRRLTLDDAVAYRLCGLFVAGEEMIWKGNPLEWSTAG